MRDLERKAALAELLLDAGRQLGEALGPDRVYDRFHELLADVVQHDGIVCSVYDAEAQEIRCEYAWVGGNRLDPAIFPRLQLNPESGMQSQVIRSGDSLLVNDVAERVQTEEGTFYVVERDGTMRKVPDEGEASVRAALMVPVKLEGRVVGVVQLMSDRQQYTPEQLEIVEGLVGQMAAAVRNARLQDERRRLEAAEAAARAVAAEREQAANVLEAVGDGVFLVDEDGLVQLWNRAAARVTGMPAEQICRRPVTEAFAGWEVLSAQIPVVEGRAAPRAVTLPVALGERELWLSFVAVHSPGGVVYAFRDVTTERRLEEEKSDFIATISHELRTPMAAVYGASMTLLRPDVELPREQERQLLRMIATQAARLGQITEEVLVTRQLDRGELRVDRKPVDIAELVRTAVDAMEAHADASGGVNIEVAPNVGPAAGDPDRIQQVLVNLLDNALKYGQGGRVTVTVDASDGRVRIKVADAGPGISEAEQERIFEKFYRSDPHLTRAPGGTGLGLYIARELVRRMGGQIGVESQPGAGSTFTVELPKA